MKFLFLSSFAHLALDSHANRVSGGAELQVALLSQALARLGHEVTLVGSDMPACTPSMSNGIRLYRGGRFHTGSILDTLLAIPRVIYPLLKEKPDCVLILGWTTWLYLLLRLRSLFGYRLAFICGLDTEINGEFRRANFLRGAFFEKAVQAADIRYAMSEDQEKLFRQRNMQCSFYRNLILSRAHHRTAPKEVDLLWVARCQQIKQPHRFLDLVEKLPGTRCQMICPCEDQKLWESVKKRAEKLPHLTFLERVPYHQIQKYYDAAKIFVSTSLSEGWPNSFIQAGLGSTALLSLNINPDGLFEKFFLGKFVSGNFGHLVENAREMLASPEVLLQMQKGCEEFVGKLHNNDDNVQLFLDGLQSSEVGSPAAGLEQVTNSCQIGMAVFAWSLW